MNTNQSAPRRLTWHRTATSLAVLIGLATTGLGAASAATTPVAVTATSAPTPAVFSAPRLADGTINLSITPATTDLGTQKAVFIVGVLNNAIYVRTRSGWIAWTDDLAKLPSIDGDATTGAVPRSLAALNEVMCGAGCADALTGLKLYLGYGNSAVDMITQGSFAEALYLRPSIFTPNATDMVDLESAYYPKVDLLNIRLKAVAGDPVTIANVNSDTDPWDAFVPEMKVHFSADDYPVDGKTDNAKLRIRGKSTRLAAQKSYRVKLSSGIPLWRGEQTLQFNKHPYDLSRMRNKLAMDLFREVPHLNSLRTQFARIVFDDDANAATPDVDYGLYTHVEKMGKEYLGRRNLPTTSVMYKAEDFQFQIDPRLALKADGSPVDTVTFETALSIENSGNHALLAQMLADVNNSSNDFNAVFDKYFNRNNYLTWLATSILLGNYDTLSQNFGLLQLANTTRYYFVPWDYDGSLGWDRQADNAPNGKPYYPDWQYGVSNWWGTTLHRRFLEQAGNLDALAAAVAELREKYLTPAQILAKANTYKPLIEATVTAAPDANRLPLPSGSVSATQRTAAWNAEVQRLSQVIDTNHSAFKSSLENPMPFFQAASNSNGQLVLNWDISVDLQGDAVSYTVQVATQPDFADTSLKLNLANVLEPGVSTTALSAGTYYMKVVATDSKGNRQIAFDTTTEGAQKYFGVLRFTLN